MKVIPLRVLLPVLILGQGLFASEPQPADEKAAPEAPRQATPEEIKARLAEHAEEKALAALPAAKVATPSPAKEESPEAAATEESDDDVTMMQEITVSSSRISELDLEIKKLDRKIERAKKRIKPTELDSSLNSDKTPKALLIFGGKTAGQRQAAEAERLDLMETERDILEAMKHVRTRKQEQELQKQLNAFRTMQVQLDEELR